MKYDVINMHVSHSVMKAFSVIHNKDVGFTALDILSMNKHI